MASSEMNHHAFTAEIIRILETHFGRYGADVLNTSTLIGYLNTKTKSASSGSKARGAFANHYALYVVVEDYIKKGYLDGSEKTPYAKYEGAKFSDLFVRQRELPFGAKLQNHALNSRLNDEFKKYYPSVGIPPIVRDVTTQRYWIQEDLLLVKFRAKNGKDIIVNIAQAIIDIINAYVATKKAAFESFLDTCRQISELGRTAPNQAIQFVIQQLQPNVDARVFEIVSFAVLKARYGSEVIWMGRTKASVTPESLVLYKTGRTNANDGGIDFVMRPLGRFFQVTETIDVKKYFLDIDKVQRFPLTFVVKSTESAENIRTEIRRQATAKYKIEAVVDSYMKAVEEIINVNDLVSAFSDLVEGGGLQNVMEEIVMQSRVEFNYSDNLSVVDE